MRFRKYTLPTKMNSKLPKKLPRLLLLLAILSIPFATGYSQELITMERAMEIAAENSPSLQQSKLAYEQSQQKLNAQRARLKSQFSLTLDPISYNKTNSFDQQTSEWYLNESARSAGTLAINQRILPTDGVISLHNTFSYNYNYSESNRAVDPLSETFENRLLLSLTQPIFTYNRTKMELRTVQLNNESAYLRYQLQKLNLERNVAEQFYTVHSQKMRLSIANEELINNESSYAIIKNKVEGGLLALEELYQAEVNLATSRSSVFNASLNYQNTMDQFKVLVGMPVTDSFLIVVDIIADSVYIDEAMATRYALENRMELREREISIEQSMFDLIQAKSTNEFAGSISASFGMQAVNPNIENLFDKPTNTPSVGLSLAVPLFDWGERKSEIKAAEASLQRTEIDLEIEKIDIVVNIRAIVRSLENLINQVEIQQKTVKNATLTYDINLERYRNGDLTSLDLGIIQNQLSDKKMALTNAIINYKLELLNLKIQTLYDFENLVSIVPEKYLEEK